VLPQAVSSGEVRALLDAERVVYEQGGFGARGSWGSRAALAVVDVTYGFVGHGDGADEERYPNWCGESTEEVSRIAAVAAAARASGVPVIYTTGSFRGLKQGDRRLTQKHPRASRQPEDSYTIVPEVSPEPGEAVLSKQAPSAFFGTPLAAILMAGGIDTLVVVGCSTSGCVRATVVDAFSYGLAVVLVSDAVFDRSTVGHEVTLFETGQKYADVVTTDEVVGYLAR
jgi:maleamate amidohydrolase